MILGTSLARMGVAAFGSLATNRRYNVMERHGIEALRSQAIIERKAWETNVTLLELIKHDQERALREAAAAADHALATFLVALPRRSS